MHGGRECHEGSGGAAAARPVRVVRLAVQTTRAMLAVALGSGAGSASRRPLGVAVAGGLAFSQLVTLYVTPVFYAYFDELPNRWRAWRHRAPSYAASTSTG